MPIGVIGGEGNTRQAIELIQHAIGDAAFILPDVDELAAAGLANDRHHGLHPAAEHILREQVVVDGAHLSWISMARIGQVRDTGQRDAFKAAELFRRLCPCVCEGVQVSVPASQPRMPGAYFRRISVGYVSFEYLLGIGEARLIDEVPAKPWDFGKSFYYGADVGLLRA